MTRHASSSGADLVLAIDRMTTIPYVQKAVRERVRALGGSPRDEWNVAIAASEAATNIVKFATTGTLTLRALAGGVELVAEDDGPGFEDPERALRDHVSEGVDLKQQEPQPGRRGLGTGLGAIARAMSELRIERTTRGGARLVALRRFGR